jgi:small subunit ribosomal protein S17
MDKTAVVEVERVFQHSFYGKVVRSSKKFKAHDEKNECSSGDLVQIMETKPMSRDKRWRVVKILGKGKLRAHELPKKKEGKEDEVDTGSD